MEDEVTYICKRTVVSTKPVQPGKQHQLSVLDRLMENHHTLIVYYYDTPASQPIGELTRRLRESIAEVLSCYPIITGRLTRDDKGHWVIKCNDAGVRMVEATAKGSVESWLQHVSLEKELKLVHWEEMFHKPYFWSTFYVQLTEFEDGGLAVGLSCSHLLADPICATLFMRAWAEHTLLGKILVPPLFHSLPRRHLTNKDTQHECREYTHLIINHYKSIIQNPKPLVTHETKTVTFAFSEQNIRSCVNMAQTKSTTTPFSALAALFWASISRVKGTGNGGNGSTHTRGLIDMSISLDMREVLGLDNGFFGNCMVHDRVVGEGLDVNDVPHAARAVEEAAEKMNKETVLGLIEWLQQNDEDHHHHHHSPPPSSMDGGNGLICINLENLNPSLVLFDRCFELVRASYHIRPLYGEGSVVVLPTPYGNQSRFSRTVMVTLSEEDEIVRLCEDDLITYLSPTILMHAV